MTVKMLDIQMLGIESWQMTVIADALIGLFFKETPHFGHSKHYLSYVEKLRPELAKYSELVWLIVTKPCLKTIVFYPINFWKMKNPLKIGVTIKAPFSARSRK